jgi:hypothetical protein
MPSKEMKIRALLAAWRVYRKGDICKISKDLYCVRNPGFHGCPSLKVWPPHLIDPDPEIVSSVEHYFLCRCLVGTGQIPAWEMRLLRDIYVVGKKIGVTPRHNPSNPIQPPSALRRRFQNEGITDGEGDLAKSGKKAPSVSMPPTY